VSFPPDVNLLVALIDPPHGAHDAAHAWCDAVSRCPNTSGSPAAAAEIVAAMRSLPGHSRWADDLSLVASEHIDATRIVSAGQVTDT
jgi:predicted nucleic acid-binding protein